MSPNITSLKELNLLHDTIDYRETINLDEFINVYLTQNIPVLIGPSLIDHQPISKNWINEDRPNFQYFKENFKDKKVQVTLCNQIEDHEIGISEWDLLEFFNKWQLNQCGKDFNSVIQKKFTEEGVGVIDRENSKVKFPYYLKDWHFEREFPEFPPFQLPNLLKEDWVDRFYQSQPELKDDFRFVYMGGSGTFTPFHIDVFHSYSWSTNLCGRKKWIMFPPSQKPFFTDRYDRMLRDLDYIDLKKFPNFNKCQPIIFIQNPGETVFVPSGWAHQVVNIGDTISVNRNWANSFNLNFILDHLKESYHLVKRSIDDCRDMEGFEEHCQFLLNDLSGLNFEKFIELILVNLSFELNYLNKTNHVEKINYYSSSYSDEMTNDQGKQFHLINLKRIHSTLVEIEHFSKNQQFHHLIKEQLKNELFKLLINSIN